MLEKAAVKPGAQIADIGAGDGFLTIPISNTVGAGGHVFAVDIDSRRLDRIRDRARDLNRTNIEVVHSTERDPKLTPNSLDGVIVLRAYHEFTYYQEMLAKIHAALRPGGRLVMADVAPEGDGGSREDQMRHHVLAPGLVVRELKEAGFRVVESRETWARLRDGRAGWMIAAERP